jgi:predicted DNA-binding transcriptional regulator AlpA
VRKIKAALNAATASLPSYHHANEAAGARADKERRSHGQTNHGGGDEDGEPPKRHHLDQRAENLVAACEGPDDELLNTRAVAAWLGVSTAWLEIGRSSGRYGPRFQRLAPQVVRYRRGDVKAWLAERSHASTRKYGN